MSVAPNTNNIGFLRLALAVGVIIGHSPELIDGDRSHEPLTLIFGTISLGELCVDGFFLLSGYLITKSMLAPSMSLARFLRRRALRIYPAYSVCFLLSCFVLGCLVGGHPCEHLLQTLWCLLTLQVPPIYPGTFAGWTKNNLLNGSMWTIAYEFRCYLLIAAFGALGLLRWRPLILGLAVAGLMASVWIKVPGADWRLAAISHLPMQNVILGQPASAVRLTSIFLIGAVFFLYRIELRPLISRKLGVFVALLLMLPALFIPLFAECALVTLGAIALFWLALHAPLGRLQKLNANWDVSYGVYLYGWPVAIFIVWVDPTIAPIGLTALTLCFAVAFGAISWFGIEIWFRAAASAGVAPDLDVPVTVGASDQDTELAPA